MGVIGGELAPLPNAPLQKSNPALYSCDNDDTIHACLRSNDCRAMLAALVRRRNLPEYEVDARGNPVVDAEGYVVEVARAAPAPVAAARPVVARPAAVARPAIQALRVRVPAAAVAAAAPAPVAEPVVVAAQNQRIFELEQQLAEARSVQASEDGVDPTPVLDESESKPSQGKRRNPPRNRK